MHNRKSLKYHIIVTTCCICLLAIACILLPKLFVASDSASDDVTVYTKDTPVETSGATQPDAESPISPLSDTAKSDNGQTTTEAPVPSPIEIDMSKIHVIDLALAYVMDQGRSYPDPEACVESVWKESDIVAYYGTDFVPPYLPAGLQASEGNDTHQVVLSNTGEVWEDTVLLHFYHDYFADVSPMLTEDIPAPKGFHLNASKIGLLKEYNFVLSEIEGQISDIGGTPTIIGYQAKPYGPYTEDTHEPAGYYDFYVAQFALDGTEYELVFEQVDLEEVVKVVASLICGDSEFVVKNQN